MDFLDQGYHLEHAVLSAQECDASLEVLTGETARGRAGTRHLMSNAIVRELAYDERLLRIARGALGGSAVPFRATLFAKSWDTNWLIPWHQDTALPLAGRFEDPDWASWSQKVGIHYAHAPAWALARVIALRIHFDESSHENGPLRVVPGSHLVGILTDDAVSEYVKSRKDVECVVARGGVLAMRPLLIHCSSKAKSPAPRRVLHIEYTCSLELVPGIQLAVA